MNILILVTVAWFGATCTLARNVNVEDAKLLEFIRLLDVDGNSAVSLQEVRDKAHEIDQELAKQMGDPGMGIAEMARRAVHDIDQQGDGDGRLSFEDLAFLDTILGQGFGTASQLMDTDRNNQISHVEIITFADLWSRPMPLIVYPDSVIPRYIGVKVDTQLSYEEMKNEIEGAATMLIGALDSNGDEEISQGEVIDGVKGLIRQAIQVVDQNGDDKISPEELVKATNPDTLSDAFMRFYDANGDGEVRFEDLQSVEERYREDPASALRDWADDISDAIKSGGDADRRNKLFW